MPRSAPQLLVVDGSNLGWRAACGFPRRIMSRSGRDITAVFGFFALLRKAHRELEAGAELLVCFDAEQAPNPRIQMLPSYKHRVRPVPSVTPYEWFSVIQEGLDLLSIPWLTPHAYEADDDIATVCAGHPGRIAIMSADHDFLQLVDRRVCLLTPWRRYRVGEVIERYRVHPRQWCDFRALVGDPSDNIPGVVGIGPKRAAYLLHRGRFLEDARIPDVWWGDRVRAHFSSLLLWRDVIRLRPDQSVAWQAVGRSTPELPRATDICEYLDLWR